MSQRKNPFENSFTSKQIALPLDEHIQETGIIEFDNIESSQSPSAETVAAPSSDLDLKDCELLYGAAMETVHCLIATRKDGVEHRELPEERRRLQGKMLYNICKKYDITIPTELEVLIFGGALIADWQYMTVKESEPEQKQTEPAQEQPEVVE